MDTQTRTCVICNKSGQDNSNFHRISYDRTQPDEPSLAERVSKIIKIEDIYGTDGHKGVSYPLLMCSSCLEEMVQVENAIKVKKKFKRCFKKKIGHLHGNSSGNDGCVLNRSNSSGAKSKRKKTGCELTAADLELCIRELDELITHILQDELISKSKGPGGKVDEPEVLSTELTIVKEMFCEMEKEVRRHESTSASSSSGHVSVIHELLQKHRITSEYKDRLVQHLKRMVSYISKNSSKFECSSVGLQKFCTILETHSSQSPNKSSRIEDNVDVLSISSSLSSTSCSSMVTNLKQSVDDIFKSTAAQIAQAWREASNNAPATSEHPGTIESHVSHDQPIATKTTTQTEDKTPPEIPDKEDEEQVIGSQMQKIINGQEDDEEVIDIESVESDDALLNEETGDKTGQDKDATVAPSGQEKTKTDVTAGDASNEDGPMIISDDEDENINEYFATKEIKKETIEGGTQDEIQEIEQAKKDVPIICLDSDEDDSADEKIDKESSCESSGETFQPTSMLSYEESRWQIQTGNLSGGGGNRSLKAAPSIPPTSSNLQTHQNNSNSTSRGPQSTQGKVPFRFSNESAAAFGNRLSGSLLSGNKQGQELSKQGNQSLIKRQGHSAVTVQRQAHVPSNMSSQIIPGQRQPPINSDLSNRVIPGQRQPQMNSDLSNRVIPGQRQPQMNSDLSNRVIPGQRQPPINSDLSNRVIPGQRQPQINSDLSNRVIPGQREPQMNSDLSNRVIPGQRQPPINSGLSSQVIPGQRQPPVNSNLSSQVNPGQRQPPVNSNLSSQVKPGQIQSLMSVDLSSHVIPGHLQPTLQSSPGQMQPALKSNIGGLGQKKFNFGNKMKQKKQKNQQGNANNIGINKNNPTQKQQFQFKKKQYSPYSPQNVLGSPDRGSTSKLDIIPVIPRPIDKTPKKPKGYNQQTVSNPSNIQQTTQNQRTNQPGNNGTGLPVPNQKKKKKFNKGTVQGPGQNPTGLVPPNQNQKFNKGIVQGPGQNPTGLVPPNQNKKFKFKKKQQGKKQRHFNPGSKPPPGAKQPANQVNPNPQMRKQGGINQPNKSGLQKKTSQPPVMQVLGNPTQTLQVKASW